LENLTGAALGNPSGEGLDMQLARWQERWESLKDWLPKDWSHLSLSNWNVPEIHLPKVNLESVSSSSNVAPVLGRIADLLPLLYVAIGALLILAVVRMIRAPQRSDEAAEALGPWPVAPDGVESRRQLIRAFDYLAQLRLGPNAKAWHHRAVAGRLPRGDAER